jgi:hypothetical protein
MCALTLATASAVTLALLPFSIFPSNPLKVQASTFLA